MRESTLVTHIRRAVERLGCSFEKRHGSVYGHGGDQDIFILVPMPHAFPVPVFVEVKVPGKPLTPRQEKRVRDRQKWGAVAISAWSVSDVTDVIEAIREHRYEHQRLSHDA